MSQFYEELCNMIIRPSRQKYQQYDLGNPYYKSIAHRKDFELEIKDNLKLKCSFYQQLNNNKNPCVVYLHSFNGSRLESIRYSEILMDQGYNFCSFDFAGCGNSQGDYVSLGYHEKYHIMDIINHISKSFQIYDFVLWGRSMGASCIITFLNLLHTQKNNPSNLNIMCCIMDSPFSNLTKLAIQIAQSKISIPQIFIKAVFLIIKNTIEKKANFKVDELNLLDYVNCIKPPVLILTSKEDNLVKSSHAEDIYNQLRCPQKELIFIKGQHHQSRDNHSIDRVIQFINKHAKQRKNERRELYKSMSKCKYEQMDEPGVQKVKLYLNFTPKFNKPQQTYNNFINSRHQRSDSYNGSPHLRKLNFVSVENPILQPYPSNILLKQFNQTRKSIQSVPSSNNANIGRIIYQPITQNNQKQQYQPLYFTQQKQKNKTQMSNQNVNKVISRLFQDDKQKELKQHSNIINSKLKKKKKDQLFYEGFKDNYKGYRTVEQFSRTLKSSTAYKTKIEHHLVPKCEIISDCFPDKQINKVPLNDKKNLQKVYMDKLIHPKQNMIGKRVKNAISLRNFEDEFQSSKEIKLSCYTSKSKNLNQQIAAKKYIILKSPKKFQQLSKY